MHHFVETQIIQCPNKKSFDDHLGVWSKIVKIGHSHSCHLKWNVLSQKNRTFILEVSGASKQAQQNALINVMKFLFAEGIEPAVIISTKTEPDPSIIKALAILEA
tara:strand:+ start:896 stop:1210 length:315 start_codon:yes stop_codon:yes gene_type:complete